MVRRKSKEELLEQGKLTDPFEVVHVDSHADLGLGCSSSDFLQSAFLTLILERVTPDLLQYLLLNI